MFGQHRVRRARRGVRAALEAAKRASGVHDDVGLDATALRALVAAYQRDLRRAHRRGFPQDPREQLDLAVRAVFESWNAERAVLYRRQERIPADLGTAVNVVAMVFGNLGRRLRHRRGVHPRPGDRRSAACTATTCPTRRARTWWPASATRVPLAELERATRRSFDELTGIMAVLEGDYQDLCDIEFTIERGTAVDAADPGRQAHRGGRVRDRRAARRRGRHRPRRGAAAGHRRAARPS